MPKVGDTIAVEDARLLPAKQFEIEALVRNLDGRWQVRRPGTPRRIKKNR